MHALCDYKLGISQGLEAGVADFISYENLDLGRCHETFLLTIDGVLDIKKWYGNSLFDVRQTWLYFGVG